MRRAKQKEEGIDWGSFCSATLFNNAKEVAQGITGGFKKRVRELVGRTTQRFIANILIFIGLVFLMVGISVFLNEMLSLSNGVGYAIVGMLVVMVGVVVNDQAMQRKR